MIELSPRDQTERAPWAATLDLADLPAGLPWTPVGVPMIMLHAFETASKSPAAR